MPTPSRTIVPADALARWSKYSAMLRDCDHSGAGRADGVLLREELDTYISEQKDRRTALVRNLDRTDSVDMRLRESEWLAFDMDEAGIDGLSYLPDDIRALDLPDRLNRRAVDMLMNDDVNRSGRIIQPVLDAARARVMNQPAPSMHLLKARTEALAEIDTIARELGYF